MGFGKDGKGAMTREHRSQALGTLGNATAILIGTKLALTDDFRLLKANVLAHIVGLTAGEGNGLFFGLADGDLSLSEIKTVIENGQALDANDVEGNNRAQRPVWLLSQFDGGVADVAGSFKGEGGAPMLVVKPRWSFSATKSWNWFVYNRSGGALQTGATVFLNTTCFGVWIR